MPPAHCPFATHAHRETHAVQNDGECFVSVRLQPHFAQILTHVRRAVSGGRGNQTKPKAVAIRWFIGQLASPTAPSAHWMPFSPPRAQNKSENEIEQQLQLHRLTGHGQEARSKKPKYCRQNRCAPSPSPAHSLPPPPPFSKRGFNFGRRISQLKRTLYRHSQTHTQTPRLPLPRSFVINTKKSRSKKLHEWKTLKIASHDAYSQALICEKQCEPPALFPCGLQNCLELSKAWKEMELLQANTGLPKFN